MPGEPDLYVVLGVTPAATAEEIRTAYRRIIRSAHPDTGGSDDRFRLVHFAYETLSDGAARAAYDGARTGTIARPSPAATSGSGTATRPARSTVADESGVPYPTSPHPRRAGCVISIAVIIALVIGFIVLIAALLPSGPTQSATRSTGSSLPGVSSKVDPETEAFARWSKNNLAAVDAIDANTGMIGTVLTGRSGVIDLDALRAACEQRRQLLDRLEAAGPSPRDDIKRSLHGYLSSERRAMSACLASPSDLDQMGTWGERARPDYDTIVKAMRGA